MFIKEKNKLFFVFFLLFIFFKHIIIYSNNNQLQLGIETISHSLIKQLQKYKIGLVTNQTGKDQNNNRSIDILYNKKLNITKIFVPEHGLDGTVKAGNSVFNTIDAITKIPVVSLYQQDTGKIITEIILNNTDIIMFDIQDSGIRHYTYISTLLRVMQAAQKFNKKVIILDRPNPLGARMEGPLVEPDLISFISIASIPLRHGMTIGELARYFNKYVLTNPIQLHVVKMKNYTRHIPPQTLLAALSPNIPSITACHGYSFLGLLGEIKPFDVGVGTNNAFQLISIPKNNYFSKKQWGSVQELLKKYDIESNYHAFVHHEKKIPYHGVSISIKNINTTASFTLLLSLLNLFKNSNITPSYSALFDKAVGTKEFKKAIDGTILHTTFFKNISLDLNSFFKKAHQTFLYKPYPTIEN